MQKIEKLKQKIFQNYIGSFGMFKVVSISQSYHSYTYNIGYIFLLRLRLKRISSRAL